MKKTKAKIIKSVCLKTPEKSRMSTLERYYRYGVLDMVAGQFNGADRKTAGELLAKDYYLGHFDSIKGMQWRPDNIPTTGEFNREQAMYYKERYLRAMKQIPEEFWSVVRRVCIDDLPLVGSYPQEQTIMNSHAVYHQKILLNHGLDRLIYFYFKKN
jgi:hypothetical protein